MSEKTKPEAVKLLLTYLSSRSRGKLPEENGCTIGLAHGGYDIRGEGVHLATIPDRNPSERDVLLAYRLTGLEPWRDKPLDLPISRCKSYTDRLRNKIEQADTLRDDVLALSRELREWLWLLEATMTSAKFAAEPNE